MILAYDHANFLDFGAVYSEPTHQNGVRLMVYIVPRLTVFTEKPFLKPLGPLSRRGPDSKSLNGSM